MTGIRPVSPAPVSVPTTAGEGRYAHPGLDPDITEARIEQGRVAEYQRGELDPGVIDRGAPAYFRSNAQLREWMQQIATRYPDLVEVRDIGDSSAKRDGRGGHDIMEIRLGNKAIPADKRPTAMWIAGEHAREIANPALMTRWVETMLEGYGTDPEATSILDNRQVSIVPMMNPDGYEVVEQGYSRKRGGDLMQRKNTTAPDGTDLNRNYDFGWGGPGASSNPHSETYRGGSAASEAEVAAIQNLARESKPGIFVDWHSYSQLVLYPWGHTRDKAPDHEGLKNVAERFAQYNHYTPIQSVRLYPTSGTSDAYTYGELGIPSFGIETGRSFHMDEREFDRVWAENLPVMNYSAKIADAPYERVKGPDALDVYIDADAGTLQATISDSLAGSQAIAAAEAVLDLSTPAGSGVALEPADGAWDTPEELVRGSLGGLFESAEAARQLVYVRAKDAEGNWGPATAQWLELPADTATSTA